MPTKFNNQKLETLALTAEFLIQRWDNLPDTQLARELLREGLRKLHDHASSERGEKKFLGHSVWSKSALKILKQCGNKICKKLKEKLRHEHVVPVNVVVEILVKLKSKATAKRCKEKIIKYSQVAIITRVEEKASNLSRTSMPPDWKEGDDIWARYKAVGLFDQLCFEP